MVLAIDDIDFDSSHWSTDLGSLGHRIFHSLDKGLDEISWKVGTCNQIVEIFCSKIIKWSSTTPSSSILASSTRLSLVFEIKFYFVQNRFPELDFWLTFKNKIRTKIKMNYIPRITGQLYSLSIRWA